MTGIEDFVALVREECGLDVRADDVAASLDELPGWDSLHLLTLATALERETGRRISLPDLLDARSLRQIYVVAVGG